MEVRLPPGRVLTWEDLQTIPDDEHHHYELFEGALLVSPSPDARHQTCVLELAVLLRAAVPPDLQVFIAPFDFVPRPGYALQPDLMVVRRSELERQRVVHPPVLAVEVVSASSRSTDRSLKRLVYEEHGVENYWILDPAVPSLTALRLTGDSYRQLAEVRAEEPYEAQHPFAVTVVPARLLDA